MKATAIIFDFTWIGLNEAVAQEEPEEAMRFDGTLCRIIRRVLLADPQLGLVYLGKVDLANAYMRIWVRLKDTPSVVLLISRKKPTDKQLVGFHIYLLMGYVYSSPLLCMSMVTIADMENVSMGDRHRALTHSLEVLADVPMV